jgi:polyisoprenoid-binding protein YceI
MFNKIAVAVLLLSLCACGAPRPRPAAPQPPIRPGAVLPALPAAGTYKIDSLNSELEILVYRAGPLANLGHNHVMVSHAVTGAVQVGTTLSTSSFSLAVPADSLVVDDVQSRRAAGEDFPGDIPEDAKSGTRRNMLSAAVLNAAEFPTISVTSVSLAGTLDALSAELTISVAGHEAHISAPCTLQGNAHTLTAVGSMELRQTAIGLTPYSLLHGALQVQDAMRLKYSIVVPLS